MSDVRSINCTQCGAPLELHGGHKVRSLNCGYCGSVMDSHEGYKVVQQFKESIRPSSPLLIGAQGKIKGIDFTVIGMVQYQSAEGYGWLDLQMYSPTHGYHCLSYEDGHFIFNRRTRDIPRPAKVEHFKLKKPVFLGKQKFALYEQYRAKIQYVEGELTWVAKQGDWYKITEATAPPQMLSYEESAAEEEYYRGEYLEPEVIYNSFEVDSEAQRKPQGTHMAQPYKSGFSSAMGTIGGYFTLLALLALVVILFLNTSEQERLKQSFSAADFKQQRNISFQIKNPKQLLELRLNVNSLTNNWAAYDIIIQQGEKVVFALGKEISFYEGRDSEGYWSEGSREANALFKLPEAGEYTLKVDFDSSSSRTPPPLFVELYEGVVVARYFFILFGLGLVFFIWKWIHRGLFESSRWQPVMEDDDG